MVEQPVQRPAAGSGSSPRSLAVTSTARTSATWSSSPIDRRARVLREHAGARQRQAGARPGDRRADPQGSARAAALPRRRRARLPHARPRGRSLSGGEAQRIRLATQIGSRLVGVLYILDEPRSACTSATTRVCSPRSRELRDLGNTVIVVEHDEETMQRRRPRDRPRARRRQARRRGRSPRARSTRSSRTRTRSPASYLSGELRIPVPASAPRGRRRGTGFASRARASTTCEPRRRDSARAVRRGHRRVGLGQVHADRRHSAPARSRGTSIARA